MKRLPYAVLVFAVASAACAKKAPPPAPTTSTPPAAAPARNNDDDAERRRLEEEARRREMERRRAILSERIFFAYDRSDISNEAATTLQTKLPILREDAAVRLHIEGHADERGSIEYNLALGLRRAQAVKDYLARFGVDVSRLTIESYGEDRPLDSGSNESAWARNRRADFGVSSR